VKIKVGGKEYWVYGEHVEVYIPAGPPRVMKASIRGRWRGLNPEGPVAKKVKEAAAKALKLKKLGGCEGLEAKAVAAGISGEMLGMWRRGSMSNEMLMHLIGEVK
jgi:hypothetical protein